VQAQGWYRDPSGAHDDRWFSAGRPTSLVRDGGVVSREDQPRDEQPQPRDRVDHTAIAILDRFLVASYRYPYWTMVLRCVIVFIAAGLFVAWSLHSRPTHGFELSRSAVAWVRGDRAVQVVACLAAAALLIALARRPRWRHAVALTMWGTVLLQIGSFSLSGSQYPGDSCWTRPGWTAITLSYYVPAPTVTTTTGKYVVVTVPAYSPSPGGVSDVGPARDGILQEECTISLPGNGRRAIFVAIKPGSTALYSDEPPSPFAAPSWSGTVVVKEAGA
jgi:hypothetical protein